MIISALNINTLFSMWEHWHLMKRGQAQNPTVIISVVLVLEVQRMLAQAKEVLQVEGKTHNRRPTIMGQAALVDQLERDPLKEWNCFGSPRLVPHIK